LYRGCLSRPWQGLRVNGTQERGRNAGMDIAAADPKGLVRESYAIEGITLAECRSIFLDWALSLGPGLSVQEAVAALLAHYAGADPGHPMTATLKEGLAPPALPVRRGGRAARLRGPAP
jgi:hypothetical protein